MKIAGQSDSDVNQLFVPKGKKKKGLPTIAESSDDDFLDAINLSDLKKVRRLSKRPIMEETDSDGFGPPPSRNSKPKAVPEGAAENLNEPEAAEHEDVPPLKKLKVAEASDVNNAVNDEGHGKKKKVSVREAVEAIQKDNSAGKRFGDGPVWNQRGKEGEEGDRSAEVNELPNQDQIAIGQPHARDEAACVFFFFHTSMMLTLDPTTLFYWSLSDPGPKKMKYSVESWAKTVPSGKPASRATDSIKTGKSSTSKRSVPALTTSRSKNTTASTASVLTADIAITTNKIPPAVKIQQDKDAIISFDGGLSDCEEVDGVERTAALASPIKGKRRLDSEVCVI